MQSHPQAGEEAADEPSSDHLDVEAMKKLCQGELAGEEFYGNIADVADDERIATLLRRNGREEANHARRLARAISIKLGEEFTPQPDPDAAPATKPKRVSPKFLAYLVQAELDGDADYQRWAANEPDPRVARLLRLNGREETNHANRVREVLGILEAAGITA